MYVIIGFVLLLLLLGSGMWIAFAMGISAIVSLYPLLGWRIFSLIGTIAWDSSSSWVLIALPLFILMGEIISSSGTIVRVFSGVSKIIHGVPGNLLQANIAANTVFAAVCGSSVAAAATMGRVAYPEQAKAGYDRGLILGSLAAGGTLAILIPPSIMFIIYGAIAEQSVGRLFLAGVFPGLLLSGLFMTYIALRSLLDPRLVPGQTHGVSLHERLGGVLEIWPFLLLIIIVLGGIYSGITTPTEAAGVGALGAILICIPNRTLSFASLRQALLNTVKTTSMVMLILIAAKALAMSIAYYGVSAKLALWGQNLGSPLLVLVFTSILYLILGCFLDGLSMVILTLPFLLPIARAAGIDLIWFGVIIVILVEMSLLTPPVAMNLFVLQGVTGEPLEIVIKGSVPFAIVQAVAIVIIILFPQIALWLPTLMKG